MNKSRKIFFILWILIAVLFVSTYIFNKPFVQAAVTSLLSTPPIWAYSILFILGSIRGFTLLPSTLLIIVGLVFIPPVPLFIIILAGIIISSISVYYFFEYLHIDRLLKEKYRPLIEKGSAYLSKYELPVIIFWSMTPFLPTDLICYLAGTARVNIGKFILGIIIGEAIICAVYIFGGLALFHAIVGF